MASVVISCINCQLLFVIYEIRKDQNKVTLVVPIGRILWKKYKLIRGIY